MTATDGTGTDGTATDDAPPVERWLVAVVAVAVVAGTVARFLPRSDLWLDEALSVNISRLPLSELGEALRRDGHPPLYYVLLHVWTAFGSSDWWVRALSGLISVLGYPLAYLAGTRVAGREDGGGLGARRVGLLTLAVYAVLPYGVRYGAETRMYSLVMVLVFAGYLLLDDLLSGRRRRGGFVWPAAGLAAVTAALLWTHYWALWLAAGAGALVLFRLWRERGDRRTGAVWATGALALGGLAFLPWVPSLLYQSANTGTPWGEPFRPATMLVVSVVDFAGGSFSEPQSGSYLLVLLAALGVLGTVAGGAMVLRWRVADRVRSELVVLVVALAVAWTVSWISQATFASRYSAVVFPLFVLLVAAGVGVARSTRATAVLLALVTVVGVFGSAVEVTRDRTQVGVTAEAVLADLAANGDGPAVVVTCPDQLAPATVRALDARTDDPPPVLAYPTAEDPRFVDWVDYAARNRASDPAAFAGEIAPRIPADATVYVVANMSYLTFEDKCEQVIAALAPGREVTPVVAGDAENFYEAAGLWVLRPRT